jgi:hypothetical protein
MEIEIKHVNFFDGQFLQQSEFIEEQLYHIHMRRKLYFVLFDRDGVLPVGAADLTIVLENAADQTNKSFHVRAGMAISLDLPAMERKEIILRQDSAVIDLNNEGFPALGPTAFVAINFEEEGVADPASAGDVLGNTRILEKARITVHASDPTGTNAANGHPFIVLGAITFATMAVNTAQRQTAQIRGSLLGAAPLPPQATILSIAPGSGLPGTTFNATITGTNLNGATAVNFSDPGVTGSIQSNPNPQTLIVAITITAGAAAGPQTFTVTTPQGTADSTGVAGAAFSVGAVTPVVVTSFAPGTQFVSTTVPLQTNTIIVRGTNIRNAANATGTIVRFVDPANPATVIATSPNVAFLPDASGLQRLTVEIPLSTGFTPAPPLPVRVQVEFNGVVGTSTTNLQINV